MSTDTIFPHPQQGRDGLTKRELFAAMAMQALCGDVEVGHKICDDARYNGQNFAQLVAGSAVDFADALLSELTKGGQEK